MTIQEMLDTIESLNSECLYNLPNFTFDEVCENFIKGKFPDSVDDEQIIGYYHDGAGADSIKSEMSSIKGNLNKVGKNITAIQSCFKKQNENIIVFGTNETFIAQLEDAILSMSKALSSAVSVVYQLPNDVLNILAEMKKIKEEIEKSSIDIFEHFKKQQEDTDNIKKEIEDINKEIGGFTPGMTDVDWQKVNAAIQDGIDSAIQKEIGVLLEQLRNQGVAINNLRYSQAIFVSKTVDGYLERGVSIKADSIKLEGYNSANNGFAIDTNGSMTATSGKIGGFKIGQNYLGLEDDSEYGKGSGMYLSNDELVISGESGRQVTVGTWSMLGYPILGRFNDDKVSYGGKTGISISVKNGGGSDNVALALNDGIVTGLGFKTKVYGLNSSTTDLGTLRETIGKDVGAVMATTTYYTNGEERHRDIELTLPTVTNWNEGHIIFIKRGPGNSNALKIKAGMFEEHKITCGEDGQYHDTVETHNACLVINNNQEVTEFTLGSEGDSCILIFFPTLAHSGTSYGMTTGYKGGWYQWKTPRD